MTLKQQLQKTEEEFDEKFVRKQSILEATEENPIITGLEPPIEKVKKFIRQAQTDAVKAFAEEIDNLKTYVCSGLKDQGAETDCQVHLFIDDINNLLKDI